MKKTKVFVVILNWNKPELTLECIKSIQELRIKNYELRIVVVDNGSTDNSVEEINKFVIRNTKFKIQILINDQNLGFAGGNNVGISYALENGADYVMVLNNDTIVDKNLLVYLIEVAKKYPKAGALSPKIYFAKGYEFQKKRYKNADLGKIIWYAGGKIDWKNVLASNRGVDEVDHGQYDKVIETDFATGTCMLCRAEVLKQVGLFDEKYFMYYEDNDLSQRMKKAGWKVLYAPPAHLWHKVAQSSAIGSRLNDYFIIRNRLVFGMKYAPIRAKLALLRESFRIASYGPKWQKIGATDFYLRRYGKGSWK